MEGSGEQSRSANPQKNGTTMTTYTDTELKSAIARSISHNEIVTVECDDIRATLDRIDNDEDVTELDHTDCHATDGAPMIDCYGKRLGSDWRLYLVRS